MVKKLAALKQLTSLASHVLTSQASLSGIVQELSVKIAKNRSRLKEVAQDLTLMMKLLRAYAAGTYHEVPWKSMVSIVAACLYFLNPLDLVPDFLVLGMIDDVQVVMLTAALVRGDLRKFKKFLAQQKQNEEES